jgi:catecholate siderophore receptor
MIDTFAFGRPPVTDLFNPTPFDAYRPNIVRSGASTDANSDTKAAYIFDTIKFKKIQFDLGLRYDHVKADYTNVTAAKVTTKFNRTDKQTTGRAALVYKPVEKGTIYAGYSTAFYPSFDGTLGITMAATGFNAAYLKPELMENLEAGVKWEHKAMMFQAALFQMEKTNTRTVDTAGNQVLAGDQRVRGAEFNINGNITPRWSVLSGLGLMRGRVLASGVAIENDAEMAYVPHLTFNLFSTYRVNVGRGLTLGAGVNHNSGHFHNQTGGFLFVSNTNQPKYVANAAAIQAKTKYWVANAMASYPIATHLDLQVNLNNIGNTKYADRSYDRHFLPGPARQLLVSTNINW